MASGYNYYLPFSIDEYVTLGEARCEVTTAGAAGSKANCSLYRADKAGQPIANSLIRDWGEVATDVLGVKTLAGAGVLLAPGRYVMLQRFSAAPTMRCIGYSSPKYQNVQNTLSGTPFRQSNYVAAAYAAAAPASPPAWTSSNVGAQAEWRTAFVFGYSIAA